MRTDFDSLECLSVQHENTALGEHTEKKEKKRGTQTNPSHRHQVTVRYFSFSFGGTPYVDIKRIAFTPHTYTSCSCSVSDRLHTLHRSNKATIRGEVTAGLQGRDSPAAAVSQL